MTEPRWLDDTQQEAWRGLLCLINRGFPEIERTFKEHDLFGVHFSILVALSEACEQTLRLSDLAEMSNVSQSRLTHRLRTLTERKFVAIIADPHDRRAKNATLTKVGVRWLETVAPAHVEDVRRVVFDHLNPDETKVLAASLSRIADHLCHENNE